LTKIAGDPMRLGTGRIQERELALDPKAIDRSRAEPPER